MAIPRIGGTGLNLGLQGAIGSSVGVNNNPLAGTNVVTLTAGELFTVPAGTWLGNVGQYTSLQWRDPVSGQWRLIEADSGGAFLPFNSDGTNIRLANLTGTPVGALITNAGSGLTNGIGTVTITPSAGASTWTSVVGGAINSTVTITAGGTNYTYPPILVVAAPPAGGIQATATCAISGGVVNAVTVVNQGAGYVTAPVITVINDPRDTTGSGAVLTVNATLAGSGTLTAMYPNNPGTALTAVPTFTFSPASSIAATAVMNFVVTGYTVGTAGVAYSASVPITAFATGGIVAGSAASNTAGPINDKGLTSPRIAVINGTTTAGGATQIGGTVVDAGFGFQAVPNISIVNVGVVTTQAVWTATVGGITDTSWLQPI